MAEGRPLPKFGEWDVNDPTSAEGFTVIFAKASNEKKSGGKDTPPEKDDPKSKHARESQLRKPHYGYVLEKCGSDKEESPELWRR